jgi:hypothetical protein
MFDKKELKEKGLESLIEHLMGMGDGEEKAEECSPEEMLEKGSEEKPKVEMKVVEVKAKPKFKVGNVEMEDESIEEILERKKKKELEA